MCCSLEVTQAFRPAPERGCERTLALLGRVCAPSGGCLGRAGEVPSWVPPCSTCSGQTSPAQPGACEVAPGPSPEALPGLQGQAFSHVGLSGLEGQICLVPVPPDPRLPLSTPSAKGWPERPAASAAAAAGAPAEPPTGTGGARAGWALPGHRDLCGVSVLAQPTPQQCRGAEPPPSSGQVGAGRLLAQCGWHGLLCPATRGHRLLRSRSVLSGRSALPLCPRSVSSSSSPLSPSHALSILRGLREQTQHRLGELRGAGAPQGPSGWRKKVVWGWGGGSRPAWPLRQGGLGLVVSDPDAGPGSSGCAAQAGAPGWGLSATVLHPSVTSAGALLGWQPCRDTLQWPRARTLCL